MASKKKMMSGAEKSASRARKEPRTAERKKARRDAQLTRSLENKVNRARGVPSPWEAAKAIRAAGGRRVSGAA